jgi:hypothetical protein
MHRLALGCAIFAFGILGSPAFAQQAPADQALASAQVPPQPEAQPLPEPPPFPPLHKVKPSHRTVNLGNDYPAWSTHHSTKAKRHAASAHKSSTKHKSASSSRHRSTKADRKKASGHPTTSHHETVHASRKTIRACHAKSYTQIMKNSICRALMRQDLDAADRHTSSKHKSKHTATKKKSSKKSSHKATTRHTTTHSKRHH